MKREIIYTNKDDESFTIEKDGTSDSLCLRIINSNQCLFFMDGDEVDEFCQILTGAKSLMKWK